MSVSQDVTKILLKINNKAYVARDDDTVQKLQRCGTKSLRVRSQCRIQDTFLAITTFAQTADFSFLTIWVALSVGQIGTLNIYWKLIIIN